MVQQINPDPNREASKLIQKYLSQATVVTFNDKSGDDDYFLDLAVLVVLLDHFNGTKASFTNNISLLKILQDAGDKITQDLEKVKLAPAPTSADPTAINVWNTLNSQIQLYSTALQQSALLNSQKEKTVTATSSSILQSLTTSTSAFKNVNDTRKQTGDAINSMLKNQ